MTNSAPLDYLNPNLPAGLQHIQIPVVVATAQSVKGYGWLVDDPANCTVEITRWPAQGWRPVDTDCGDEGGTTEGVFYSTWKGDILYGSNEAVGGNYVLGYATAPEEASTESIAKPSKILIWHANYHPDGGQMFFPLDDQPYLVPVALPGDDVKPADFI